MGHLLRDLRYALRRLRKSLGFTAVVLLTLALGIGATTTLFSVVHGVLLRPLPYPDSERVVRVFEVGAKGQRPSGMADPNFADLENQNRTFEALAQFQTMEVSVAGGDEPARIMAGQVSHGFFDVMGAQPAVGRTFLEAEQQPGAAPVAVVSHGYWQRYLQGDPDLSQHTLRYGEDVVSVVGVMPPGFQFPEGADLWIPREQEPMNTSRTALNKKVIGRLAPDVALPRAQEDLSLIAQRLKSQYGDDIWMVDAAVVPLRETLVGSTRAPLLLLLGASAFLLLIACANVVNLLLARAVTRQREFAVRVALGAGRARLTLQALTESLVLSLLGGALGVVLAYLGVAWLSEAAAGDLPRLSEIRVDGVVLLFALGVSVLVALGLALLAMRRVAGKGVRATLVSGQRTQAGGRRRLRGALVVSQVALTLVLLVGTGLLLRSFQQLLQVEPGYRTSGGLVLNCHLPYPASLDEAADQKSFYQRLMTRLERLPGVRQVGGIDALPLKEQGASGTFLLVRHPDEVTDFAGFEAMIKIPERTGQAEYRKVTEDYFQAMEIPLLRGRLFDSRDQETTAPVAVVSESLVEATWPDGDALGQLVQFGNMDGDLRAFRVVGVVADVRDGNLEAQPEPTFYSYAPQRPRALGGAYDLVLITDGDAEAQTSAVRRAVLEIDPLVAPSVRTLAGLYADSLAERRLQLSLLLIFGATALVLAVVGIYGVIAFYVARRQREMGVRLALGATGGRVVGLVVRQGLLLVGVGIVLGLAGAFVVSRFMESLLYEVGATDPWTFVVIPLVLAAAATLACFLPARRAAQVDPVIAMRTE